MMLTRPTRAHTTKGHRMRVPYQPIEVELSVTAIPQVRMDEHPLCRLVDDFQPSFPKDWTVFDSALSTRQRILETYAAIVNHEHVKTVELVYRPQARDRQVLLINVTADNVDTSSIVDANTEVVVIPPFATLPMVHPPHRAAPRVSDESHRRLLPAYHRLVRDEICRHSNITSIAIDYGYDENKWDDEPSLVVRVFRKGFVPWGEAVLPLSVDGVKVRVVEGYCHHASGDVAVSATSYMDPVRPGAEIALRPTTRFPKPKAGTMGLVLTDTGRFVTCAHVATPVCVKKDYQSHELPQIITQPHTVHWTDEMNKRSRWQRFCDCIRPRSPTIGNVESSVYGRRQLQLNGQEVDVGVDVCVCAMDHGHRRIWSDNPMILIDPEQVGTECFLLNRSTATITDVEIGARVVKRGRSTGVTFGVVDSAVNLGTGVRHNPDVECTCPGEVRHDSVFLHQYRISLQNPTQVGADVFATAGDSGALVYVIEGRFIRPFALFHAYEGKFAYATPIEAVLCVLAPIE
jgi:hypothetical protein